VFIYNASSESPRTQLDAFKGLVSLTTQYPGLRLLFAECKYVQHGGPCEEAISASWARPGEECGPDWNFYRDFACACICDDDICRLVENSPPQNMGCVETEEGSLSIIERLLIAAQCE
jgi:hypothetical protein